VDFVYLSSLLSSALVAIATFPLVREAPRSLLCSLIVALGAFSLTFAVLFVCAHKREFPLLRYYCRTRRMTKATHTKRRKQRIHELWRPP
jgi:hypothetical protein